MKKQEEIDNLSIYKDEEQGFEFKYPQLCNHHLFYAHPERYFEEKPKIIITPNVDDLVCEEREIERTNEFPLGAHQKKITIEGKTYCKVTGDVDAAPGVIHTGYKYSTIIDNTQITLEFIIGFSTCVIWEVETQEECQKEKANFNPDILAHQILSTFRFLE